MFNKRLVPVFIACCMRGSCAVMLALAVGLTMAKPPDTRKSVPGKVPVPAKSAFPKKEKSVNKQVRDTKRPGKPPAAHVMADKAKKRADKERQRKIVTYSLYGDPDFKLRGAVTDKRHFGPAPRLNGLGTGLGYTAAGNPVSRPAGTPLPATAFKAGPDDSAGIAFNCHEKFVNGPAPKRELSACYSHEVDKSWKTQTYVSRRRSERSQDWGGGVALGFAY